MGAQRRALFTKISIRLSRLIGLGLVMLLVPRSAKTAELDLLQIPKSQLESCSDIWTPLASYQTLRDGRKTTGVNLAPAPDLPLDLVFGFEGDVVTVESLWLQLDEATLSPDKAVSVLGQVEVWVSMLSPRVGFQLVREDVFCMTPDPQTLVFSPRAAKWILVRFKTQKAKTQFKLAELKIFGQAKQPESRYAFKETPASALAVVAKLQKNTKDFSVSAEEKNLFMDARDGVLNTWSMAEAALLASGVKTGAERAVFLKQIDDLTGQAKQSLGDIPSDFTRAERLLQWLHQHAFGGYAPKQTDLSGLLSTRAFNCVSSAVLYNLIGRALGLDLRAVEVPDHVFSILYAGLRHADIETTTPNGFNPSRNPAVIEILNTTMGFKYISDENKDKRRELSEIGLVALIYYNHGVMLAEAKHYPEALLAFFCSLNLDPEFASAIRNVLVVLGNWGLELSERKQYAEALQVTATGLELAPQDQGLQYNQQTIWALWLEQAINSGEVETALQVVKQAEHTLPAGKFTDMQAWIFIQPGLELTKRGDWQGALQLAESGLKRVEPAAQPELRKWRKIIYADWADKQLEKKAFKSASEVLEAAMKMDPSERVFRNNLGFVIQEWAKNLRLQQNSAAAEALLFAMHEKYPKLVEIARATAGYVYDALDAMKQTAAPVMEAIELVNRTQVLIPEADEVGNLIHAVYDTAAGQYLQRKQWLPAVELYEKALQVYPQDVHFLNNSEAVWDLWINQFVKQKNWEAALSVTEKAWQRSANRKHSEEKLGFIAQEYSEVIYRQQGAACAEAALQTWLGQFKQAAPVSLAAQGYVARRLQELKNDPEYSRKAEALAVRCQALLPGGKGKPPSVQELADAAADQALREKKWPEAIAAYEAGLKKTPGDKHLAKNLVAIWDLWVQALIEAKDWEQALAVCIEAMERSPDADHFSQKSGYIVQEATRLWTSMENLPKAEEYFRKILKIGGRNNWIKTSVENYYGWMIQNLPVNDTAEYEKQGLILVAGSRQVLGLARPNPEFIQVIYDRLAERAYKRAAWQEAIAVYTKVVKQYPQDAHLRANAITTWDAWAQSHIRRQEWQAAVEVYQKALAVFPAEKAFANNLAYCQEQIKQAALGVR